MSAKGLKELKKAAKARASIQEPVGSDEWFGIYYGYMWGYQDAVKDLEGK